MVSVHSSVVVWCAEAGYAWGCRALEQKVWQTLKESKQSALKVEEMMSDSEDELAIDEESMQQSLTAAY